jgi:bis(5'-nucleosidyl)-tetraphosphatase
MNNRRYSAGIIVFTLIDKEIKFLILKSKRFGTNYGFPKGTIEEGEGNFQTAKRELYEETGLSEVEIIPNFNIINDYKFYIENSIISKKVIYYLGYSKNVKIRLSDEHSDFFWGSFNDSIKMLRKKGLKSILIKANNKIKRDFKFSQ